MTALPPDLPAELVRQTNADGRVQANMLMTRIYANDCIISANTENIEKIRERANLTIEMIAEARELTDNAGYLLILDAADQELSTYVRYFGLVTELQSGKHRPATKTMSAGSLPTHPPVRPFWSSTTRRMPGEPADSR